MSIVSANLTEIVTGYDVREMWLTFEDLAHASHIRSTFYVRDTIEKALGADLTTWPSIFLIDHALAASAQGYNYGFVSLDDLYESLARWPQRRPSWIVAVTELVPYDERDAHWATHVVEPHQVDPGWKLIGFDITGGGISFISNAGYSSEEAELRAHLASILNEQHLFPDRASAIDNWQLIHDREPSHGPFVIQGLYRIEKVVPDNTR